MADWIDSLVAQVQAVADYPKPRPHLLPSEILFFRKHVQDAITEFHRKLGTQTAIVEVRNHGEFGFKVCSVGGEFQSTVDRYKNTDELIIEPFGEECAYFMYAQETGGQLDFVTDDFFTNGNIIVESLIDPIVRAVFQLPEPKYD